MKPSSSKSKPSAHQGVLLGAVAPAANEGAARVAAAIDHNHVAQAHNTCTASANEALAQGEARINALGGQYGRQADPLLAGRVTEEAHAATFNADAAMKGRQDLQAQTTESLGRPHDAADIEVQRGGQTVAQAQSKVYKNGEASAKQQSQPKYRGQQKLVPEDQLKGVQTTARQQELRNKPNRPEQAEHYRDTADKATDRLKHDGVESKPLTHKDSQRLARQARQGQAQLEKVPEMSTVSVAAEIGKAAGQGALRGGAAGAGVTLVTSGVTHIYRALNGQENAKDAAKAVGVDVGKAALSGAAKGAAGAALKAGAAAVAKQASVGALKSAAGTLARGNVLVSVGAVGVDGVVGLYKYANGDITGRELGVQMAASTSSAAGGAGGATLGAMAGTAICPVIGTAIGGLIGGLLGSMGGGWGARKLLSS